MTKITATILFLFSFYISSAQKIINPDKTKYENLGTYIGFYEDTTKNATFEAIKQLPGHAFKYGENSIFNGGTVGKVWWGKLKYTHQGTKSPYIIFEYSSIDSLDIFYKNEKGEFLHVSSGTFSKKQARAIVSSEFIYRLPHANGETKEVYIRAKSINTLILPIKFVNGDTLTESLIKKYIWQILYVGITLSIFLFNIYMLISTKDSIYALYIVRIIFLFYLYLLAYLNGYANFFGNSVNRFVLVHAQAFAAIGFIATIYFNNRFLSLKTRIPNSIKWFNLLIILWLTLLILSFWDTRAYTNRAAHILLFITSVSIISTSFMMLKKTRRKIEDRFLIIYLLGWLPISLSIVYVLLTLINVLPIKEYTFEILNIGAITEAILIGLAVIGGRIKVLREEKEEAEQHAIKIIKERNEYLEEKIKERTTELQLANDKLKVSSSFKDKLFSIIAHDMRTPLSSLRMALQLADLRQISTETLYRLLENIKKNTEQVQKTMDNLLNWSISQMNLQNFKPELIHVSSFLEEHIDLYATLAADKEINTNLVCPDIISITADRNQLSLIIRNLMDNAVKFTPAGGIIDFGFEKIDDKYFLYVQNSGEVVSKQTIEKILANDKSPMETSFGTANEKGTGLGLQLCKEFIKNINSQLEIRNGEVNGIRTTVFCFQINSDIIVGI